MAIEIETDWLPVRVPAEDLAACVDILLENVFAHTPEGASLGVRLTARAGGGGWLVVADAGPGFADGDPISRGRSGGGSTGLGLDIARRIAEASGGSLTIGRSARGGATITLALGPTAQPEEPIRRPSRSGRSRHAKPADPRLQTELAEWSAIVGHDVSAG
jgi:signal transduction histidine kinase